MLPNLLENLDVDVRYPLGGRYFLKRYKYWGQGKGSWIDRDGKKITERVFSFIIEHGKRWDNSTSFSLLETELDTVMTVCNIHLNRIKTERKDLLMNERSERKLYPQLIQWNFKNVTISVESKMSYTESGYPLIGKKEMTIYGNGRRFEYANYDMDKDFEITYEWVMERIINMKILLYNVSDRTQYFKKQKFVSKVIHKKTKVSFVPLHFYIGYCVEVDGKPFNVTNVFDSSYGGYGFDNGGERVNVTIDQLLNIKVLGELQGVNAWCSLLNKVNYCN